MAVNKIYKVCEGCHGTGKISRSEEIPGQPPGTYQLVEYDCPDCNGKGYYLWGAWKEEAS